jgi:hypothetical protein
MKRLRWTLSIGLACAALAGCEKSSETQKREADKSAAEADKKQAQALSEADQKMREAREKAESDQSDLHAAVVREKADYRAKIHTALDKIDNDLADLKLDPKKVQRGDRSKDVTLYGARPKDEYEKLESTLLRRDRLMDDADAIDKTIDHDWPSFKERIDRDLEGKEKPLVKPGRT